MSQSSYIDCLLDVTFRDIGNAQASQKRARPFIVGIAGPPGAGKSTLAEALTNLFSARNVRSVVVPMDGFHLSNRELISLGLAERKGAPSTFDVAGFIDILGRMRLGTEQILAPAYSRVLHEPIANSISISSDTNVIVVEGNYLLLNTPLWKDVKANLDSKVFLDVTWKECRHRLISRQIASGRNPDWAEKWVDSNDHSNYRIVYEQSNLEDTRIIRDGQLTANP